MSNVLINIFLHQLIYEIYSCTLIEKAIHEYPKREKRSGLPNKIKSFHSGYSD